MLTPSPRPTVVTSPLSSNTVPVSSTRRYGVSTLVPFTSAVSSSLLGLPTSLGVTHEAADGGWLDSALERGLREDDGGWWRRPTCTRGSIRPISRSCAARRGGSRPP